MTEAEDEGVGRGSRLAGLSLLALGVVYGDIGTSPLYALRESFAHGIEGTQENVLGILSMVAWSLILVVSIKYLLVVLRADNRGEGGALALMALGHRAPGRRRVTAMILIGGLFSTALLYGDGMITPAISVLSAVEGISVAAPSASHLILPITMVILIGLFWFQRHGTAGVGRVFGPVMMAWFTTLFILGARQIIHQPQVLAAFDPRHAVAFFVHHGAMSLFVLGSVFLVVTGGEAMYADLGHFGKAPIRLAWFAVALPALLTNYFGQGALILSHPATIENPFYSMVPPWGIYPLIGLATLATIIASQAVITGAFSLTYQAVHLGYLPRLRIFHTSETEAGQIYLPLVNWGLLVACLFLVGTFQSSGALAGAYGLAVSIDMVITTILVGIVATRVWKWHRAVVLSLFGAFLVMDLAFLAANSLKLFAGGWFPLMIGGAAFAMMATWRKGRSILGSALAHERISLNDFVAQQEVQRPRRIPGTAVYMALDPEGPPPALLRNLEHHRVLHERVVLLTMVPEEVAHVLYRPRVEVTDLGHGFWQIIARHGFMEDPDVSLALDLARYHGLEVDMQDTHFFVGLERVISTPKRSGMAYWRERLFAFMVRNAQRPSMYFHLPRDRVIEVGVQVEI